MAIIDLPTDSAAETGEPAGITPATLDEVIRFGDGLTEEQYSSELAQLIGHDVLVTTISTQHISPLKHTGRFPVPFTSGPIFFEMFPTKLDDIHHSEILFPYEHTFMRLSGEPSPRVLQTLAPIDRAVTTIYLPA